MKFSNRREAGKELAGKLSQYANRPDMIVLGLPRGGVVIADEVAKALQLPLDIFVVRKLELPEQPDLGLGAIATGGTRVLNYHVVQTYDIPSATIDEIADREHRELLRQENTYRGNRLPLNIKGKAVIVVNDGLLTGATMRAAVSALEKHQPAARIVAVPVSSFSAFDDVGAVVDEIVCLHTPAEFESIGEFYQEYPDVSDDEVASILASAKAP